MNKKQIQWMMGKMMETPPTEKEQKEVDRFLTFLKVLFWVAVDVGLYFLFTNGLGVQGKYVFIGVFILGFLEFTFATM